MMTTKASLRHDISQIKRWGGGGDGKRTLPRLGIQTTQAGHISTANTMKEIRNLHK